MCACVCHSTGRGARRRYTCWRRCSGTVGGPRSARTRMSRTSHPPRVECNGARRAVSYGRCRLGCAQKKTCTTECVEAAFAHLHVSARELGGSTPALSHALVQSPPASHCSRCPAPGLGRRTRRRSATGPSHSPPGTPRLQQPQDSRRPCPTTPYRNGCVWSRNGYNDVHGASMLPTRTPNC